jgi:hypothetical protein
MSFPFGSSWIVHGCINANTGQFCNRKSDILINQQFAKCAIQPMYRPRANLNTSCTEIITALAVSCSIAAPDTRKLSRRLELIESEVKRDLEPSWRAERTAAGRARRTPFSPDSAVATETPRNVV